MSAPEPLPPLPGLPRDDDGPVFAEPWQAQAFAMAVHLNAAGAFTWTQWAAALAAELKDSGDDGSHYYDHWLAALETLLAARGLADPETLAVLKADWAHAYEVTPHGKPVELVRSAS